MTTPFEDEARAELDRREEYAEAHGHPTFQDEGSAFLEGVAWAASRVSTPPPPASSEEWEYGYANFGDIDDVITAPGPLAIQEKTERGWAEGVLQPEYGDILVRRRRVGAWEPVPAVPVLPTEPEEKR